MHPQLREKLVAVEYLHLAQLSSRASKVEQYVIEKEQRSSHRAGPRGPQMVLVIDCDSAEEDVWEEPEMQAYIMVAEFVQSKPYICPTLTHSKGKEVAKLDKGLICLIFVRQIKYSIAL